MFQKTRFKTQTSSTNFSYYLDIPKGMAGYAGIMALDKYIPSTTIHGLWEKTSYTKRDCSRGGCTDLYQYKWNNDKVVGTWQGHIFKYHRVIGGYGCITKTIMFASDGDPVLEQSNCAPAIPKELL